MNFKTYGQYNIDDYTLCLNLHSKITDDSVFRQRIYGMAKERFQEQKAHLIPFIFQKFSILWANSSGILYWAVRKLSDGWYRESVVNIVQKINLIDFAIMFVITIACVIGTVIAFFKDVKPVLFFCLLTFFGFNLMEVAFEVQTRYRTVVMPLLIFFSCWTLSFLSARMKDRNPESPDVQSARK